MHVIMVGTFLPYGGNFRKFPRKLPSGRNMFHHHHHHAFIVSVSPWGGWTCCRVVARIFTLHVSLSSAMLMERLQDCRSSEIESLQVFLGLPFRSVCGSYGHVLPNADGCTLVLSSGVGCQDFGIGKRWLPPLQLLSHRSSSTWLYHFVQGEITQGRTLTGI